MKLLMMAFYLDEAGQDLSEYTLLIVFVLLAIIGLATGISNSVAGVTSMTNANLAKAQTISP